MPIAVLSHLKKSHYRCYDQYNFYYVAQKLRTACASTASYSQILQESKASIEHFHHVFVCACVFCLYIGLVSFCNCIFVVAHLLG